MMDHYDEVKDCIDFNHTKTNYRCEMGIVDSKRPGRYNCVKYGKCASYRTIEAHRLATVARKEVWERETYERLKKKFATQDSGSTTQEIYNKIQEIKKEGNWIESPFRHIVWVPKEVD